MILDKIYEMSYNRVETRNSIEDHIHQIIENWCLIWVAKNHNWNKDTINHWSIELVAQMGPGLAKLEVSKLSPKSKLKLIDEALYKRAEVNRNNVIIKSLLAKFSREGISDLREEVANKWIEYGLPKVRSVYRDELGIDVYESILKDLNNLNNE